MNRDLATIVFGRGRWPLLAILALVVARPARSETLEEAWAIALAVNDGLKASGELAESAAETLAAARAGRCPRMANRGGYIGLSNAPSFNTGSLGIPLGGIPFVQTSFFAGSSLVSQPLYTSGRICNTIAAAQAGVDAAHTEEARTALDLKMSVADAYVGVLYARQLAAIADGNVANLEAHVRTVENLLKQGLRARNDLLSVQVSLADARQQTLQTRNQLDAAQAVYNRYLGRCLTDEVQLAELMPPETCDDVDALTHQALDQRPELAGLRFQQQGLCREAEAVKAEVRPQVAATGGLLYFQDRYLERNAYGIAAVGVSWELDSGITKHRVSAIQRRACALAAQRADLESTIALQVRQAWLDAQTARNRVSVTRVAIDQAEENVRVTGNRYRDGVGGNTEYLDALTLRTRSLANYYNSLYNAVLAVLRLRRAVGDL